MKWRMTPGSVGYSTPCRAFEHGGSSSKVIEPQFTGDRRTFPHSSQECTRWPFAALLTRPVRVYLTEPVLSGGVEERCILLPWGDPCLEGCLASEAMDTLSVSCRLALGAVNSSKSRLPFAAGISEEVSFC